VERRDAEEGSRVDDDTLVDDLGQAAVRYLLAAT